MWIKVTIHVFGHFHMQLIKLRSVFSNMPALYMHISALKTSENFAYDLFANISIGNVVKLFLQ